MKKKAAIILAFLMVFSVIATGQVHAEEGYFVAPADAESVYTVEDFEIRGDTVYGFSKEGVKKLKEHPYVTLPEKAKDGTKLTAVGSFAFNPDKHVAIHDWKEGDPDRKDVDDKEIRDIGESFHESELRGITIPEGYTYIGQDAFDFNVLLSEADLPNTVTYISEYAFAHCRLTDLVLPSEIERIGDNAFFDAGIRGVLGIPASLKQMGERAFKGNHIEDLMFDGEGLEEIPENAFEDNHLTEVSIPDSIKKIHKDAFNGNTGHMNYGYFVVIKTKSGKNANKIPNGIHFYVDPGEELRNENVDINYRKWENSDFIFEGNKIKGFSPQGKLKVRQNKNLVLPSENNENEPILEIMADAFRNVDFGEGSLRKYDLESVTLPNTLERIGDYAFQSNNLEELKANISLKYIGQGAFMNNKISALELNKNLETIDNAAFHINTIFVIDIPENVKTIGFSAFRNCSAMLLNFKGTKVKTIGEMAFLSNALTALSLPEGIESIEPQTFASNKLTAVQLPESLVRIGEQAFAKNEIESMNLPENVADLAFNAFEANRNGTAVILHTKEGKNEKNLPDGIGHRLDPNNVVTDKQSLSDFVKEIEAIEKKDLRESTVKQYEEMLKEGKKLLEEPHLTKSRMIQFINDGKWFMGRLDFDRALAYAEKTEREPKTSNERDLKNLRSKIKYAVTAYNNFAVKEKKLNRTAKELRYLADLCNLTGEISGCYMDQGVYELDSPLPIPPYFIGVNMYYKPDGTIFYILDMSYTIGEGRKNEFGKEIENVDEDNQGYHELAITSLDDYEGVKIDTILNNDLMSLGKTEVKEEYKYHLAGIYEAVRDASKDAKKRLERRNLFPLETEERRVPEKEEKKEEKISETGQKQDGKASETTEGVETKKSLKTIKVKAVLKGNKVSVNVDKVLKKAGMTEEKKYSEVVLDLKHTGKRSVIIEFDKERVKKLQKNGIKTIGFTVSELSIEMPLEKLLKSLKEKNTKVKLTIQKKGREYRFMLSDKKTGAKIKGTEDYRVSVRMKREADGKERSYNVYVAGKRGKSEKIENISYDEKTDMLIFYAELFQRYLIKRETKET